MVDGVRRRRARCVTGTVQGWEGFGFTTLAPATMELVVYDADGKRQFACDLAGEAKTPALPVK